jgi:AraC-like DNA-binding protein
VLTDSIATRFRQTFGLSIHAFQTRLRMRHALRALRQSQSNVDAIARDVGYRSTKNLYERLNETTGLTPHAVRQMPDAQFERLFEGPLAVPIARRRVRDISVTS